MKPKHWLSVLGTFELEGEILIFKGGTAAFEGRPAGFQIGNFVSDVYFGGGVARAKVTFRGLSEGSGAGLILYYHPPSGAFVQAQLGVFSLCSVRTWGAQQWTVHATQGQAQQLQANRSYDFRVSVHGSRVTVTVDDVRLIETNLPVSLPHGQAGIWAVGPHDVAFEDFSVETELPRLFVVMQFTQPFNELYTDVIKPVGEASGFQVVRADETYSPGVIIADIERQIVEARAIVADVTPNNPNVYWEVGYAHALRKPTVLVAERNTKLPFDVSPFRTLFYDDTIAGKVRIEEGLRKHLATIQAEWGAA